jgi:hypothetical protein
VIELTEEGSPQGAVISPLLANIYLHYVFDLWANQWRTRHAEGNIVIVRYADDIVVGFDKARDATRFKRAMQERLEQFALSVHPEKTRLIEFGRFAAANRAKRGLGKPETFNFLGFTHISGRARSGKFMLRRAGETGFGPPCGQSRMSCGADGTTRSLSKGNGCGRWFRGISTTTPGRPTPQP